LNNKRRFEPITDFKSSGMLSCRRFSSASKEDASALYFYTKSKRTKCSPTFVGQSCCCCIRQPCGLAARFEQCRTVHHGSPLTTHALMWLRQISEHLQTPTVKETK
jgi:hypothetical protein